MGGRDRTRGCTRSCGCKEGPKPMISYAMGARHVRRLPGAAVRSDLRVVSARFDTVAVNRLPEKEAVKIARV
jgi:hypothetical protein